MKVNMTNQELLIALGYLRKSVNHFSAQIFKNIIFFNAVSFYLYLKDFPCRGKQTIEDIVDRLEPYIPLKLTQDNFDLFMNTVLGSGEASRKETETLELMVKVKGDFVYSVQTANTQGKWSQIVDTCESIRQMKEAKMFHTLV
ncbi:MAG: hypothetical protein LBT44_09670 [Clostridiales bacterium]|nr:hypothetical protein [Clostridiales bacterium]